MTLLVAIRQGCHFCEASMPFYKRLGMEQARHSLHAYVVCVAPDSKDEAEALLKINQVAPPVVGNTDLSTIDVTGTPTLLLVDRSGRVSASSVTGSRRT